MRRAIVYLLCFIALQSQSWNPPPSLLSEALKQRDVQRVHTLIEQGVELNYRPEGRELPAILEAILSGDLQMVQYLVARGANVFDASHDLLFSCKAPEMKEWLKRQQTAATQFGEAAKAGRLETIQALVAEGYSVDLNDKKGKRALGYAAEMGDSLLASQLIQLGAQPSIPNAKGEWAAPLILAAENGHLPVIRLLLDHGALMDAPRQYGLPALSAAITHHQTAAAKILIARGADIQCDAMPWGFPLAFAAIARDHALVELLLAKGAHLPQYQRDANAFMLYAAAHFGDLPLFMLLVDTLGLDTNAPLQKDAKPELNPLLIAARYDSLDLLRYMVEQLHYSAQTPPYQDSPLNVAAASGHIHIADYLLQQGADILHPSVNAITPLGAAAQASQVEMMKFLIKKGALSMLNSYDPESVKLASLANCLECARLLVKGGANPAVAEEAPYQQKETLEYLQAQAERNKELGAPKQADNMRQVIREHEKSPNAAIGEYTLLTHAAAKGDLTAVQQLLQQGADPNRQDANRRTALLLASRLPQGAPILRALVRAGADVNAFDAFQGCALAAAVTMQYRKNVTALLKMGADPNLPGQSKTPLEYALMDRNDTLVDLLLKHGADPALRDREGGNVLFYCLNQDKWFFRFANACPTCLHDSTPNAGGLIANLRENVSLPVLKALLDAKLNPNLPPRGYSMLEQAFNWDQMPEKIAMMADYGLNLKGQRDHYVFWERLYERKPKEALQLIDLLEWDLKTQPQIATAWLHNAFLARNIAAIDTLMRRGATMDLRDEHQQTPLFWAYQRMGDPADSILRKARAYFPDDAALQKGINAADESGHTLLIKAMATGDTACAREFLSWGADVRQMDKGGVPAVLYFPKCPASTDSIQAASNLLRVKWLIAQGADPMVRGKWGHNLLIQACFANDKALAQFALEELHIPINDTLHNGISAFGASASGIIFFSAHLDGGNEDRRKRVGVAEPTPYEQFKTRLPLMRYLLSKGASVNVPCNCNYGNPVIELYMAGQLEMQQQCMAAGFNLNRLYGSHTLFWAAIEDEDFEYAKTLIRAGANPKICYDDMYHHYLRILRDPEIKKILEMVPD